MSIRVCGSALFGIAMYINNNQRERDDIKSIISSKRGSLLVDAACCLPIFILSMVLLLYLLVQCGVEETSAYVLARSAHSCVAATALVGEADRDAILKSSFGLSFAQRLQSEQTNGRPDVFVYYISSGNIITLPKSHVKIDQVVIAQAKLKNALPAQKWSLADPRAKQYAVFRPFVGESKQISIDDKTYVYVFPKRGTRYHIRSCSTLREGEISAILNARIRRTYAPCKLCHPETLPDGAAVSLYAQASHVYHRQNCATVKKSYIYIPKSEAISAGYTPCILCGGGHR